MSPHKFKSDGQDNYSMIVYCEFCGYVAFWGNYDKAKRDEQQIGARQDCPQSTAILPSYKPTEVV